jgi:N-acetylmuramoyl-L-alanine amidase
MPKKLTLILDAAHGSNVLGKRSPDGSHLEYIWSRVICKRLRIVLQALGYTVYLTVDDDLEPGLMTRVRRANSISADDENKLFISLHNNAAGDGRVFLKASGAELWTAATKDPGYEWCDQLAELYATRLAKQLKHDFPVLRFRANTADDASKDRDFTVLHDTHCPSILIEWLFQDNLHDLALLTSKSTNDAFVNSLVAWIESIEAELNFTATQRA